MLDPSVLRADELVPLEDDARVRVLGAGRSRRVEGGCTQVAHARHFSDGATLAVPQALVAELVDALG